MTAGRNRGKILGSWSGMRKYLEREMLAEPLRGRVRYGCTAYVGMDGCRIFEVCVDGKQIKRFSWETVNTWFIEHGCKSNPDPHGIGEYWSEFWQLLESYPMESRTEYTDGEFSAALAEYRNQDIRTGLRSPNPIVRMFSILDRRVGRKSLDAIREDMETQPEWLQFFYRLRVRSL